MRPFFRRPLPRPALRLRPAARAAMARLQQAHVWMAQGQFLPAAQAFLELGEQAQAHGLPRAPQLFLQAGRAYLLAGEIERAVGCIRRGLTLMARLGQLGRLPRVAHYALEDLRGRGLHEEAARLQAELAALSPGIDLTRAASAPAAVHKRQLPAKCPYCGGTIHPETVDWIDDSSATCDYCGSVVKAEG